MRSRAPTPCASTPSSAPRSCTPRTPAAEALFAENPFVTGRIAAVRLYASAPLVTSDGHAVGTVCAFDERPGQLDATQLGLLEDIADQVMALFELRRLSAGLRRAATRDPLTGLANRRAVETAMAGAIARAERGLGTPSVVMADLDGFKAINDAFGHAAGDAVLVSVAQRLPATARGVDTVGRLGGDEFVVLLEHTGGPGATAALSRLRRSLEGGWSRADRRARGGRVAGHHDVPGRGQRRDAARPGGRRDVRRQGPPGRLVLSPRRHRHHRYRTLRWHSG